MNNTNVVIDGANHSEFNLEWAKRGGVVKSDGYLCKYVFTTDYEEPIEGGEFGEVLGYEAQVVLANIDDFRETQNNYPRFIRMATPEECANAGIEYIEPPVTYEAVAKATVQRVGGDIGIAWLVYPGLPLLRDGTFLYAKK